MELDITWLLLGLPLAFGFGWLASRLDLRQWRRDSRDAPRAYFKGLNLLLNEQPDEAIDAFTEAVQNDPDTSELHIALGNLFRRRGDFERAVRVHEHLLRRGDLKAEERALAQRALALDFMKAGLFDRAEQAWRALLGTAHAPEARWSLLTLYERSREFALAAQTARELKANGQGDVGSRMAHYHCELAALALKKGDVTGALAELQSAVQVAPESPRPWMQLGQWHAAQGEHLAAMQAWEKLHAVQGAFFPLVAQDYARVALACGRGDSARALLLQAYAERPGMEPLRALALLEPAGDPAAQQRLLQHLQRHGHLSAAQALLAQAAPPWPAETAQALNQAVQRAAQPLQRYRCAHCHFEAQNYFWQCPGCLNWDSYAPQRIEEL